LLLAILNNIHILTFLASAIYFNRKDYRMSAFFMATTFAIILLNIDSDIQLLIDLNRLTTCAQITTGPCA
jgi:hypothetical protein